MLAIVDVIEAVAKRVLASDELHNALAIIEHCRENGLEATREELDDADDTAAEAAAAEAAAAEREAELQAENDELRRQLDARPDPAWQTPAPASGPGFARPPL